MAFLLALILSSFNMFSLGFFCIDLDCKKGRAVLGLTNHFNKFWPKYLEDCPVLRLTYCIYKRKQNYCLCQAEVEQKGP